MLTTKASALSDPRAISYNFGRGPIDYVKKYLWVKVFLWFQTDWLSIIAFLKPIYDPVTYLCNQLELFEQI